LWGGITARLKPAPLQSRSEAGAEPQRLKPELEAGGTTEVVHSHKSILGRSKIIAAGFEAAPDEKQKKEEQPPQ
jgi:hypothetical protein